MVLLCQPSDAFSQHLPSYLGFSYLGRGVSLHGCSSKAQPLLLTLDEGCLLTAAPPDLEHGVAPLGPPAPHTVATPVNCYSHYRKQNEVFSKNDKENYHMIQQPPFCIHIQKMKIGLSVPHVYYTGLFKVAKVQKQSN